MLCVTVLCVIHTQTFECLVVQQKIHVNQKIIIKTLFIFHTAKLITLISGKKLVMFEKHTYYNMGPLKNGRYKWICTEGRCKAYLVIDANLTIEKRVNSHKHNEPRYMITIKGKYLKLNR